MDYGHFSSGSRSSSRPKKIVCFCGRVSTLKGKGERELPSGDNSQLHVLADAFADYFTEKISVIRAGLESMKGQLADEDMTAQNTTKVCCSNLSKFQPFLLTNCRT